MLFFDRYFFVVKIYLLSYLHLKKNIDEENSLPFFLFNWSYKTPLFVETLQLLAKQENTSC